MNCRHCSSTNIRKINQKTTLGYKQYFCNKCHRQYNERTGTKLNFIEYPTEVAMLATYFYYTINISLDKVVALMAIKGFNLSHQTIHNWTQTFGVRLGLKLRKKRKGKSEKKWHIDPTYIKVEGRWCYLYRAIDKEGNLVDVYLSNIRDQQAAENFFKQSKNTTGVIPTQITTDKEKALYPQLTMYLAITQSIAIASS